MKNFFRYISFGAYAMALFAITGCADTDGDGEGEYLWGGSENPENTSYRNPAWEPSLAGGTVFKAASQFIGISQETEWAAGLPYACPVIQSSDLMKWSTNQRAFTYPENTGKVDSETGEPIINAGTYPTWISGKINHVTADFARTIAGANYWLIYSSDADNAFGAASANAGPGPYTDLGSFLTAADLGCTTLRYPHLSVFSSVNYYLGYSTENGSYIQGLNLRRGNKPTKKGSASKVSGSGFQNICVFRVSNTSYYLFGTVTNGTTTEIRYGRSTKATGPFVDRNGVELTDGASNGELLVEGGPEFVSPCNPMRMLESESGIYYLAYNASAVGLEKMPSGYDRKPLFISPVEVDDDGWFKTVIVPRTGWTAPRFN